MTIRDDTSRLRLFVGLRPLDRAGAARDALAGLQLAAMNIPQALGFTKIAGTPVVTGLYTLLLPQLAFAMLGSSRYLVVAADSATAAILAGGLAGMAPVASAQYVALAETVALLTAGLLLIARLLKLGFLADFLSQTGRRCFRNIPSLRFARRSVRCWWDFLRGSAPKKPVQSIVDAKFPRRALNRMEACATFSQVSRSPNLSAAIRGVGLYHQ
jgi:hypothetical protein